jgi:hypothetical protein
VNEIRYVVVAPEEAMTPKRFSYSFVACAFHATISKDAILKDSTVLEGKMELLSLSKLTSEKFCWGYETIFQDYLKEVMHASLPRFERKDEVGCRIYRIDTVAKLSDEWSSF